MMAARQILTVTSLLCLCGLIQTRTLPVKMDLVQTRDVLPNNPPWNNDGSNFPHLRNNLPGCNRAEATNNFICNPDFVITADEAEDINSRIESALGRVTDCACAAPQQCPGGEAFPTGKYSISVALPESVAGNQVQTFATGLNDNFWDFMHLCNDGIVIAVDESGTYQTSFGTQAELMIPAVCEAEIRNHVDRYFNPENPNDLDLARGIEKLIDYYGYALKGGECGSLPDTSFTWWEWMLIIIGVIIGIIILTCLLSFICIICQCVCCLRMCGKCFRCILWPFQKILNCLCGCCCAPFNFADDKDN